MGLGSFTKYPHRTSKHSTNLSNTGHVNRIWIRGCCASQENAAGESPRKVRERAAKGLLLGEGILDNPHVVESLHSLGYWC